MKLTGALLLALLLTGTAGCTHSTPLGPQDGLNLPPNDTERIKVGQPAPDFALEDASARRVTLSSFRGKFVILVFYRGYW